MNASLSEAETEAAAELRALAAQPHPYPEERFAGRGIVMCAGGTRMLTCAWVALAFLRRDLGSALPVEVWHLGQEELGLTERALLGELGGVETVDAHAVRLRHPARTLGGWELKPYAVAHSSFEEVLLLDADNLPLVDPTALFGLSQYVETGSVFWPDVVRLEPDNALWQLCDVDYRSEPAWESGQAVIDKRRCWRPLMIALHMNMNSDVFFKHSHGDKDTFHMAWRMLDQAVGMTRYPPKVVPSGVVQRGFDGEPLFQHRSTTKWLLRGENPTDPSFRHEARCLEHLAELRSRWTGRVEMIPPRGDEDLDLEAQVIATRWFTLERAGWDARAIELLPGHRVGVGASGEELRWYVHTGTLVLAGERGETCRLAPDGDQWQGWWTAPPHYEVTLRPAASPAADPMSAVIAAVLQAVAVGAVDADEAATTLATLAGVAGSGESFAHERGRWSGNRTVLDVLATAERRAGGRDPSLRPHGAAAGHRYAAY